MLTSLENRSLIEGKPHAYRLDLPTREGSPGAVLQRLSSSMTSVQVHNARPYANSFRRLPMNARTAKGSRYASSPSASLTKTSIAPRRRMAAK
jgi:hypothetical protein